MRRSAVSPVQRGEIGGIETPRGLLGQLPHCLRTGQAYDPIKAFPHAAPTPSEAVGQTAADNLATSEVSSDRWPFGSTRRWAVAVAGYIALQGAEDGVPHAHNSVSPPVGFSRSSPPRADLRRALRRTARPAPVVQIDVALIQAAGLADAQPSGGQLPDHRGVGQRAVPGLLRPV
jgi:hypothetical protein